MTIYELPAKKELSVKKKQKAIAKIKKELDALWSAKGRERDGKCALCGKTKSLQAHHYIKTKARSLKYRWDLRNGITLCYGCHMYGVHKTASYDIVGKLAGLAITKGLVSEAELGEIVVDDDKKDYGKDRGYLEACRISLENRV